MILKFCVLGVFLFDVLMVSFSKEEPFTSKPKKQKPSNILNYAGKTYYFSNLFTSNFYGAFHFCRQQGMELVSILNDAENDRLGNLAEEIGLQYTHFWTSGTNLQDMNRFVWMSTGNNIVYSNWYPGEPSNKSSDGQNLTENCIEATRVGPNGLYWNDRYCFDKLNFICEHYGDRC